MSLSNAGPSIVLVLLLLMQGCVATAPPQIYVPEPWAKTMNGDPNVGTPATGPGRFGTEAVSMGEAQARVIDLQNNYTESIRALSGVRPGVSTALIGLSALSLFKGVTSPDAKKLALAGALGSAAYAFGTTADTKERRLIYEQGLKELTCAVAEAMPYDLRSLQNGEKDVFTTQTELIATADAALDTLEATTASLAYLRQDEQTTLPARKAAAGCAAPLPPACSAAAAEGGAGLRQTCKQFQIDRATKCAGMSSPAKTTIHPPHPLLLAAFSAAEAEAVQSGIVLKQSRVLLGDARGAGQALWLRTQQIHRRVSGELTAREQTMEAILAAIRGLQGTAFDITKADAFKPPPSEGAPPTKRTEPPVLTATVLHAIDTLARARLTARSASNALTPMLELSEGGRRQAQAITATCEPLAAPSGAPAPAKPAAQTSPKTIDPKDAGDAVWEGLKLDRKENNITEFNSRVKKCKAFLKLSAADSVLDTELAARIEKGACKPLFEK